MIPDQPNSPHLPVFGGMKGCQFATLIAWAAPTINKRTTATFTKTIKLLKLADSLIPTTRSTVTMKTMITAGRLNNAVRCGSKLGSMTELLICFERPSLSNDKPAYTFRD